MDQTGTGMALLYHVEPVTVTINDAAQDDIRKNLGHMIEISQNVPDFASARGDG